MSTRFAWLTVVVCLFTLRGAAAQTPTHPLDGLTAEEYWTPFEVPRASGKVHQNTRYPAINLQEPVALLPLEHRGLRGRADRDWTHFSIDASLHTVGTRCVNIIVGPVCEMPSRARWFFASQP